MSSIRKSMAVLLQLALASVALAASSTLQIETDHPAEVFVDGELAGEAPLTLVDLAPGVHQIHVLDASSGQELTQSIAIPRSVAVNRTLRFELGPVTAAPAAVFRVVAPPVTVVRAAPRIVLEPRRPKFVVAPVRVVVAPSHRGHAHHRHRRHR